MRFTAFRRVTGTMRGYAFLIGLLVGMAPQVSGQELVVLSAPAYRNTVAPESVATAFGVDLSNGTGVGIVDATGRLPLELNGVVVRVDGHPAQLAYVSTWQINFVVPRTVATGVAEVVVYLDGQIVATGSVQVATVVPGIFALDGSGTGPGAIANSVTYFGGPFDTQTAQVPGCDKRTQLTVYASGVRLAAGSQSLELTINDVAVPIDFLGASKLFPGVDEIRFTIPEQIDSSATLSIAGDEVVSNTVTMAVTPNGVPAFACGSYGQAFVYSSVTDLLAGDLWDTTTPAEVFTDLATVSPDWIVAGVGTTALEARNGEVIANGTAGSPELVWSDPLFPPTVRSLSDEPLPFVGVGAGNPASVITAEAVPGVPYAAPRRRGAACQQRREVPAEADRV